MGTAVFFCAIISAKDSPPTLPANINIIIMIFDAILSEGVMPSESPTVPTAETTSNRTCFMENGSMVQMTSVDTMTASR